MDRRGNDLAKEGNWKWSSGRTWGGYKNWGPGQPNNDDNEDCILDNWTGGKWNDANCSTVLRYICESGG